MTDSENHKYNVPAEGTTDWHIPLNENFKSFDTDIEIRDTDANKSNYTPKDGAMYRATDTGAIYIGDGSSWVLANVKVDQATISRLGGNVDAQGNNITNAGSISTDEVSITNWDEVADYIVYQRSGTVYARDANGVEQFQGSDVIAVAQSAYNDLTRGRVHIASGRYEGIETQFNYDNDKVALTGNGRGTELVFGSGFPSGGYLFDISSSSVLVKPHISGFAVQSGGVGNDQWVARLSNTQEATISDIYANAAGYYNFIYLDDTDGPVYRTTIERFSADRVLLGFKFNPTSGQTNRNFIHDGKLDGQDTSTGGPLIDLPTGADTNEFAHIDIEFGGNTGTGDPSVRDAGTGTRWIGCTAESGNTFTVTGDQTQFAGLHHPEGLDISNATNYAGHTVQKGLIDADGSVSTS